MASKRWTGSRWTESSGGGRLKVENRESGDIIGEVVDAGPAVSISPSVLPKSQDASPQGLRQS